jgi:hypothetical protein
MKWIQMLMLNGQLSLLHKVQNTIKIYKTMEETVQTTANTAMKERYKQTPPRSLSTSLNSSRHMAKLQHMQGPNSTNTETWMYSTVPGGGEKKQQPKGHGCELYKNEAPLIPKN